MEKTVLGVHAVSPSVVFDRERSVSLGQYQQNERSAADSSIVKVP